VSDLGPFRPKLSSHRRSLSRRPRRSNPLLILIVGSGVLALIGWAWYAVFSPLFEDPKDWITKERTMRRAVTEVLTGSVGQETGASSLPPWPPALDGTQRELVACAEAQVARGVRLSTSYHAVAYPWGDLSDYLGASPDLIVRCLRAVGLDLQQMIHIDRTKHPRRYPLHLWATSRPDRSIDHRRLANLHVFARTFTEVLPTVADTAEKRTAFHPGDLIFWTNHAGGEHPGLAGIVLDRRNAEGHPFVTTLIPAERLMSDTHLLTDWPITGHFRVKPGDLLERFLDTNPHATLKPRPPKETAGATQGS
jgi:uncharacterized protein YijF (DUF1287 family)